MQFVKILDVPPAVVGAVFGVGMYIRSKVREKRDRIDRSSEREVKQQMDYIYSKSYKEMEARVYHLHSEGKTTVEVRSEREITQVPLGAYRTSFREAIKEVAFKIVLPCILEKLQDDKEHYLGKHYKQYCVDMGQDIHDSFVSALGRKVGITDFTAYIEEDALSEKVFIDMFSKIVRRIREKNKKLI